MYFHLLYNKRKVDGVLIFTRNTFMKKITLALFIILFSFPAIANHVAGGELFYQYLGAGSASNSSKYKITMRLFRDCNSSGATLQGETVNIGIYNSNDLSLAQQLTLNLRVPISIINLNTAAIPCLVNAPDVCFQIGYFEATVDLPDNAVGYTLAWIRCCRSDGLTNMSVNTGIGGTFITKIPGTNVLPSGHNSSPQFLVKDTALVCKNKNFILDFGATDVDGDSLTYSFCNAYSGATSTQPNPGANGGLSGPLQLNPLPYRAPYSGTSPLGPLVTINQLTGEITGTAPSAGRYVINVCITERRNGVVINTHQKDFILEIGNCEYGAASPFPINGQLNVSPLAYKWVSCTAFKIDFINQNNSSLINAYHWDFGVQGTLNDTSNLAAPSFLFPDTGVYKIKLSVTGNAGCTDQDSTTIAVYPGFTPDFSYVGSCFQSPFQFTDKSFVKYGVANTWRWNFGDATTLADTSILQNPIYLYKNGGNPNVRMIVTSSFGCLDTIVKPINVRSAPVLTLPFKDTLICNTDTIPLIAQGIGSFSWSPNYNIINPNSANPLVYPKDTLYYAVTLNDNGCISKDSIKVNVIDVLNVNAGNDTTICKTDNITLSPISAALQYFWTPTQQIISGANSKNPLISPPSTTTYYVSAFVGKCQDKDTVIVYVVPYPIADAGPKIDICFPGKAKINGSIKGTFFNWSPTIWLDNPNALQPTTTPFQSLSYVLTVSDTLGCPKPVSDTVYVNVVPKIIPFAGNDTIIVANQPLYLQATGGTTYAWTPSTGMNNPFIANPVVLLGFNIDSIKYSVKVSSPEGCSASDDIKVIVFKTSPDIFIPTGFSPNGDGKNDVLKPIAVGIKQLNYFRVYNRWGQLVFSTSRLGDGWDGKIKGVDQSTNTFVFMAEAVDYQNRTIVKKGTVVLVR